MYVTLFFPKIQPPKWFLYGEFHIIWKPSNIKKIYEHSITTVCYTFYPKNKKLPTAFLKNSQMLFLDITQNSISLSRDYKKIYLEQN